MTASHSEGPIIIFGRPVAGSTQGSNPEAGTSLFYQGIGLFDPRLPYQPGVTGQGKVHGYADSMGVCLYEGVPTQLSTSNIAAAQVPVTTVALTLASAQAAGISVNIPIVPTGSTTSTTVIGIELGVPRGVSTTSGSKTITFPNAIEANKFAVGDAVMIGSGAGSSLPLFTTVLAAPTTAAATTLTVNTAPSASLSNAAFVRRATTIIDQPSAFFTAGAARLLDPMATLQRGLTFTSSGDDSGAVANIIGYDIYNNIIHETVTLANGTASSLKTYKYIKSITPVGTLSGSNLAVGFSDLLGFPLRVDRFEHLQLFTNAALVTATTGFLAAVLTTPSTATTGDVRGTYALQSASDGTKRTAMWYRIPPYVLGETTPDNYVPMFGVAQT